MNTLALLLIIVLISCVALAPAMEMALAQKNVSDAPRGHKEHHPMHKKFLHTKVCGLRICGK